MVTVSLLVFFLSIVHLTRGIGSPTFQLVPNGIKVSIPVQGYDRSAIHFNINKPMSGIVAGDNEHDFFSYDISGDHWEYTFPVAAKQGDVINYWLWGENNSQGETLTGQTITLGPMLGPSTTTSTFQSTTTEQSITTAISPTTTTNAPSITANSTPFQHNSYSSTRTICKDNAVVNCKNQHVCFITHLRGYCPLTCGLCLPPLCEDSTAVHCEQHTVCLHSILKKFCPLTCGQCVKATKPPCTDGTLVNCSFAGVCSDSALKEHCPLTCGLCGKLSQTTRWIHIGTTKKPSLSQIIGR
ncbi:uncharacterized protein LOC143074380 [Mytilus galloprovincialis]|uniref:uncharacterized protein LOC143074380 n=1 Tax=Mytilus galloprovincialis TaxID=29158 RepID=UPI003F7B7F9A